MNTPVNFELAKLLSKKGYNEPTLDAYVYRGIEHQDSSYKGILTKNKLICDISAPTIADVVMWLHEKRGIWICVSVEPESGVFYFSVDKNKGSFFYDKGGDYPSPTEAYTAAIEYTLKTLIP